MEEGKRWPHLGEVSSVTGDQLVMMQSQGQERTFTVTTDAKVTLDRRTSQREVAARRRVLVSDQYPAGCIWWP